MTVRNADNRRQRRLWLFALLPLFGARSLPAAEKPGSIVVNSIGMKLAYIPAGEFMMGSPDSESKADQDEFPRHPVRITKPFYLGIHEVTQKEWVEVMKTFPWRYGSLPVKEGNSYPAAPVGWKQAMEFCRLLTEREHRSGCLPRGWKYSLPTEAQWEYACRAGTTTRFSFGSDETSLDEYAWYESNSDLHGRPVGGKRPNAWGLYDMHGNVWEWCSDWYGKDYYLDAPRVDPRGPSRGLYRAYRGSSWYRTSKSHRSANRPDANPATKDHFIGFRLARIQVQESENGADPQK